VQESLTPTRGAARVPFDASEPDKDRLVRCDGRPVSGFERRILHDHKGLRVIAREEHSRSILIDTQTMNYRGAVTAEEYSRANQSQAAAR